MKTIRLIARREWLAILCSPTGLIILCLYLLLSGYLFWMNVSITQEATLRYTFSTLGMLTVFVVPLISMRLLSEELRSGTLEILTSHPVTDLQIVLGKFLAGYTVFLALSAPTLGYLIILQVYGSPDWGPALSAYLGQQLLAAMLLALGLLVSSLTSNQVLAAMGGTIGGILLWLAGTAAFTIRGWRGDALAYLAMLEHFGLFNRGIIDTRSLTYFIATAALFIYLAVRAVESRRWKFGTVPAGRQVTWRAPRACIVLLIAGPALLVNCCLSWATDGFWTTGDALMFLLGIALTLTPGYLNRFRIRYELARRRTGMALTVAMNSLLVLLIWGFVTFLTARHYARFDTTSSKHYALSEQTRTVLTRLPGSLEIDYVMGRRKDQRQEIADFLAEYKAHAKSISVQQIDPLKNPGEVEQVRERLKLTSLPENELLVAFGDQVRRLPADSLWDQRVVMVDGHARTEAGAFVGEAELTGAIIQMTRKSPGRIAFLSGHAERSIQEEGNEGLSTVAKQLKRAGWTVENHVVTPGAGATFAEDTSVVVIANPQSKLADEDLKAVQTVLDRGGSLLVLLEPGVQQGLEALLNAWDIRLADDIVIDRRDKLPNAEFTSLYVTHFRQEDPIGKGMGRLAAVLPTTRRVAIATTGMNPNVFASPFMYTSVDSWAVQHKAGRPQQPNAQTDRRGPISVAVSCTRLERFSEPGKKPLEGRVVVIGDSDFATNRYVDMAGNLNLFLNSVDWLAGRQDLVGVRPKVSEYRRMTLTAGQTRVIFWLTMFVIPGAATLLGIAGLARRRYGA